MAEAVPDLHRIDQRIISQLQRYHVGVADKVEHHEDRAIFERNAPDFPEAQPIIEVKRAAEVRHPVRREEGLHVDSVTSSGVASFHLKSSFTPPQQTA